MTTIRNATTNDIPVCDAIARQYPAELAFVRRASLQRGVDGGSLLVAELRGQVVGFVLYHARRDGWQTIYDMAVSSDFARQGIGRKLLYSVPTPVRLKCTLDNECGNLFYQAAGMTLVGREDGRKRALNIWELRSVPNGDLTIVLVRGGSKSAAQIAQQTGVAYGVRSDYTPYAPVYMLDINWKRYDWNTYLEKIRQHQPVLGMVADYELPEGCTEYNPARHGHIRRRLYQQIRDIKPHVRHVLVCPKFHGAVEHIPIFCRIAISVKTEYAGFYPDFRALAGRQIHLLGGNVYTQADLIRKLAGHGATVVSVDGSHHARKAGFGQWFDGGVWVDLRRMGESTFDLEAASMVNIVRYLREAKQQKQLTFDF